jgi:hypothetical protein
MQAAAQSIVGDEREEAPTDGVPALAPSAPTFEDLV